MTGVYALATLSKMSPRLKLSSCVVKRLSKLETEASHGCLFGLMYDSTLLIVGYSLEFEEESNTITYKDLQLNFPSDTELYGVVKFGEDASESSIRSILQNVDATDNPLILTSNQGCFKAHFLIHDRLEETQYEVVSEEDLWKQFIHIRLKTTLPLFCEVTSNGVKEAIQSKRKKIAAGQVSFHFPGTKIYLVGGEIEADINGLDGNASVEDLLTETLSEQLSKKKRRNCPDINVIPVNLIFKTSRDSISEKLIKTAVKMMSTQGNPAYCIKLPINIDVLTLAHLSTKLVPLYNVLLESACKSLRLLEQNLLEQLGQEGIGDGAGLKIPDTFHFLPENCGYFFSQIIPREVTDDATESHRKSLHKLLALPSLWPCFKRGNAYPFDKISPDGLLINPHEAIFAKVGAKPDSRIAIVRGFYTYHHYMQDQFDDDGWGCAYRSLQTLCSWFRFQGYTDKPIPTHKQIQQCLVKIGDKMSSFVGSKQWIGSTEVSFCLESLFSVQSKIIFANSGSELQSYAQELLFHFQKHGSPIMIGGGVLAHTILGVEYCTESGETRYLILDPHYTGHEDLGTVVSKGWCSWKTNDFWNKTAHYNLCLPLTKPCV
ncbi:UFM1 specific peptidase 2 isoform X2 [Arctopsyche grandis]|uniref:UFM1 specific peptidase 2 isoform X2 n=1 Tax=Arctopsyche grandis TaxID=121162 RepID=UPI00406D6DC1